MPIKPYAAAESIVPIVANQKRLDTHMHTQT